MDAHKKTDRLNLRFVTEADVDAIQQCIVDPRIYEMVGRIPANHRERRLRIGYQLTKRGETQKLTLCML